MSARCCVLMAPAALRAAPADLAAGDPATIAAEVACCPNFALRPVRQPLPRRADGRRRSVVLEDRLQRRGAGARRDDRAVHRRRSRRYGFDPNAMYPDLSAWRRRRVLMSGGRRGAGPVTRTVSRAELQAHRVVRRPMPADAQTVVGCGRAVPGERIAIVDPDTLARLGADRVGEVWVSGPNVAHGYWRNEAATRAAFAAQIAGEDAAQLAAHRRSRLSRRRPANCSSPGGSRSWSSSAASITTRRTSSGPCRRVRSGAAPERRRRVLGAGRAGDETLVVVQEVERTASPQHRSSPT